MVILFVELHMKYGGSLHRKEVNLEIQLRRWKTPLVSCKSDGSLCVNSVLRMLCRL